MTARSPSIAPTPTPPRAHSLASARRLDLRLKKLAQSRVYWLSRLRLHQTARLSVAAVFLLGLVAATARPAMRLELPLIAAFLLVFPWLVIRTRSIARHLELRDRLGEFYTRQKSRCLGLPAERSYERAEKAAEPLALIHDLGLLGSHSVFTMIDETFTDRGEKRLLEWMSQVPQIPETIVARQKRIQSLRHLGWFYTRLSLVANGEEMRLSSEQILEFIKKPFVPESFTKIYFAVLSIWCLTVAAVIARVGFGVGNPVPFLVVFAALNFWALSRAGATFKKGIGLAHHLGELAPVFKRLEKRASEDRLLRELLPTTATEGPSREARQLNLVLSILGVEANPLIHLLINAFLPWSMTGNFFLERRRKRIHFVFPNCMEELAEFEAHGTLLVLDRYQTRTYPHFEIDRHLSFRGLFHPLLPREAVVENDFSFSGGKSLGLLTGSNMSGKSTFLRTIGVNQTLANMGAPVFADEFVTTPFRIETCIEVSDSLRDGYSYFYAEVRRLKALMRTALGGSPVLFLIDEIFRGTNNRERQIGSQAIIRKLASAPLSLGFVSTHDLELTALEEIEPTVLNLHFREDIRNGEMVFAYKLHQGPCPTTNALKIMEAEGIDLMGLHPKG